MIVQESVQENGALGALKGLIVGLKIAVQGACLVGLVIFPQMFGGVVDLGNRFFLVAIVGVALAVGFLTEFFKWRYKKNDLNRKYQGVVSFQLFANIFLLIFFLHFFGRINGPFFVLLLLLILELSLSLNLKLVRLVIGLVLVVTLVELGYLVFVGEIVFSLFVAFEFFIRFISIVWVGFCGLFLIKKEISEKKARLETVRSAERLESVSKNLKTASVKLQELSRLKDEFVSVASHELRAPMTTIKGYLSMIMDGDAGKLSPKVKEYLGMAYESSERMIRLVNNMLNVSRIESGRLIMSLDDIHIEEAIEKVVHMFNLQAEGHGLQLKYFKPKKRLPRVRVDPDRIQEVIANLVGNAISYTPHGHIHVGSELKDDKIIITVEDTGVGIAPEDQRELFRKFSQVGVRAPLKKGSGLGLYICRMLINEFGGDIWLKSKVGKGSTFYFSLPAIINYRKEEVN
ncbi:HAMP domain-containing histidine kinase [Patescibacteria group bacterium]|nr:HAMP domain-containing histidine kinase [Patescibacteria group bacterium]